MRLIYLVLTLTLISGCASVSVKRVSPDDDGTGIKYYKEAPFLLLYTDADGGIKSELHYLPDQRRRQSSHRSDGSHRGQTSRDPGLELGACQHQRPAMDLS